MKYIRGVVFAVGLFAFAIGFIGPCLFYYNVGLKELHKQNMLKKHAVSKVIEQEALLIRGLDLVGMLLILSLVTGAIIITPYLRGRGQNKNYGTH